MSAQASEKESNASYDVLERAAAVKVDEAAYPRGVTAGADALECRIGPHGYVRLLDCMPRLAREGSIGVEARVVEAARVSYGDGTKVRSPDLGLLRYLLAHQHMSPFEMVEFTFAVCCEVFTARQVFRHRTANFNEESARYSEMRELFYPLTEDQVRAQSKDNKQGSDEKTALSPETCAVFTGGYAAVCEMATDVYRKALKGGVAKEQARVVLPVGLYTRFYFKMDLRNLMHFLNLRMDAHAQHEVRMYATAIYHIVKRVAPHAMALFDNYVRGAVLLSAREIEGLRTGNTPSSMSDAELREWNAKFVTIFGENADEDVRAAEKDSPRADA